MSIIRRNQVIIRVGRSISSIYRDMKRGTFPMSVQIGPGAVGWRESEIEAWEKSLIHQNCSTNIPSKKKEAVDLDKS